MRLDAGGLVLMREPGERSAYRFPRTAPAADDPARRVLSLTAALHARVRPVGTAESVLRDWALGRSLPPTAPWDDPTPMPPVRVRAGSLVIREGRVLLIRFTEEAGPYYEFPGGGVECGETPEVAAVRELREETNLSGRVRVEVARVWKDGRREHYFLMDAEGAVGASQDLDNHGGVPVWVPVDRLPRTPVWPRRLAWRLAHWQVKGPPERPAELADSIIDLTPDCFW